jgi:arylformamidase
MVKQVRSAVAWLYWNASLFGGDRNHINLSGHSSGAHLAANVAVTDWESEFSLPKNVIKGVLCASGIYDLKPIRLSSRSNYVFLDDAAEDELSPQRHVDRLTCPLVVACGELESDEFKRQAREFADDARRELPHVELIEGIGLNHFELILTLAQPDGLLGRAALAQMRLGHLCKDGGGPTLHIPSHK